MAAIDDLEGSDHQWAISLSNAVITSALDMASDIDSDGHVVLDAVRELLAEAFVDDDFTQARCLLAMYNIAGRAAAFADKLAEQYNMTPQHFWQAVVTQDATPPTLRPPDRFTSDTTD